MYQLWSLNIVDHKPYKTITELNTCCYYLNGNVWFNNLWSVFHDSVWSFYKTYFSRKHYFVNDTERAEHKIMV